MAVTVASFRTAFPEFDTATYTSGQIEFWLEVAASMVNARRWGQIADLGVRLFAAHNLVLGKMDEKSAASGGVPGQVTGGVASKQVDRVSVSYDNSAAIEVDAGHWNLTTYGKRYIQMARMAGSGGTIITGGTYPFGYWYGGPYGGGGSGPFGP